MLQDCARLLYNAYLLVVIDVFVGHATEKLLEVLSLVALPALPVGLQVGVETLHLVLAPLHLGWHLAGDTEALLRYRGL